MSPEQRRPIRRALVSVFDKQGLDRLAGALGAAGVEVVSTGSTAAALEGHGLRVTRVEELTGFPELLDGRVKTLHPNVHAGLLADLAQPGHRAELEAAGIAPFDLVVVNLYPFEDTVAAPDVDPALAVERIDVGGPAMVRAAAKNHAWVAVVCDPADYPLVETALTTGGTTPSDRRALAAKAFARTAAYDTAVATWLTPPDPDAPQPDPPPPGPPVGSVAHPEGGARRVVHSPPFPDRLTMGGGCGRPCGTGRTRIRGRPSTPSTGRTGAGGWGRPARSPARGCPTTTCSTPTPPSPWSPSTAAGRSRPSSSTPTRAGRRSGPPSRRRTRARWRATRSAPSAASSACRAPWTRPPPNGSRPCSPRSWSPPPSRRRPWPCWPASRRCAWSGSTRPVRPAGWGSARSPGACWPRSPIPAVTTRPAGPSRPATRPGPSSWPTWPWPGRWPGT